MSKGKKKKLVQGVGINDAGYPINKKECINGKRKVSWACPYYARWCNMLVRCYSESYQNKYPTYKGCSVCEKWLLFSNFKAWMEKQDWVGKHLDKDFISKGNKIYSPDTCVFVDKLVNTFLIDYEASKGVLPLGVSPKEYSRSKPFRAECSDPFKLRRHYIGYFTTPEEAHLAWKTRKHQYAVELANSEHVTDERVRQVLLTKFL